MARIKLLVTLSFIIMAVVCRAQTDSVSHTDTVHKTTPSYSLSYFNYYYSEFSFRHFSAYSHNLNNTDIYKIENLSLDKNYTNPLYLKPVRKPFIAPDDYNRLKKPDYYYNSDPSNPFGATNAPDAFIYGSVNYLFGKLFSDK